VVLEVLNPLDLLPQCLRVGGQVGHLFNKKAVVWVLKWVKARLFEFKKKTFSG